MSCSMKYPCAYISHGGGPMPILGQQPEVVSSLRSFVSTLPRPPSSIVVVTAHWMTSSGISVSSAPKHKLYYDYGGFPKESYQLQYNAPGNPDLARQIKTLASGSGIAVHEDTQRGWDHGVFIPLMIMFPDANIPVVAVSISNNLDPNFHIRLGQALSPLRDQDTLIIGSGYIVHNFEYFFASSAAKRQAGQRYEKMWTDWLVDILSSTSSTPSSKLDSLTRWTEAPGATEMHKPGGQEEHLIPLHVIAGAGIGNTVEPGEGPQSNIATPIRHENQVLGFIWN